MSWPDLSWLRFDLTITPAAMIGVFAGIVGFVSCLIAIRTYRRSHPKLRIEPILEVYDTRESQSGRVAWYWTLRIMNHGGRALTLLGIQGDLPNLPMVLLAKDSQFIDKIPDYDLYVTDVPTYENVRDGKDDLTKYKPKQFEEYSSINLAVGPGEAKALRMAFLVVFKDIPIDAIFFNVVLNFQIGDRRFKHKLTKMAQLVK